MNILALIVIIIQKGCKVNYGIDEYMYKIQYKIKFKGIDLR